jgi:23S rRNA-/tRNA-specific pseudouridylate synthase
MSTGVMHQIRVHAAFLGVPLAGDARYGGGRTDDGFHLHHVGFTGPGLRTEDVPCPTWAL